MRKFRLKEFVDEYEGSTEIEFSTMLNLFLDSFYRMPNLYAYLEEPSWKESMDLNHRSLLVTVVHHIANKKKLPIPSWILKRKYILKEPFYLCRVGSKLHAYTTLNAIPEGVMRNVFVTKDIVSRV